MLVFVIIAIFIAGLMVGRTPEYLGKKIEAYDVKVASLSILVLAVIILGFTAWAAVTPWGTGALNNSGPHGFSEMHYAYTSGAGNNGSAFAGLSANEVHWNTTLGLDMLLGRFFMIIPDSRPGRQSGSEEAHPHQCRQLPSGGADVCHAPGRHGDHRGRPHVRAGAKHRSDCRALPDARCRPAVLITDQPTLMKRTPRNCD